MLYASKINIDYSYKDVRYVREVELPDKLLTLEDITKHLKPGEKFGFTIKGRCLIPYLTIVGTRKETKKEYETRIAKEEKYNLNYKAFHERHSKL